jgi:flavin-dependent dehydrogenase
MGTMTQTAYDAIIVGGRVAGSALAARLGLYGWRVLLLERDTLPSLPAVSSPIIYASTMHMLDEIGADEAVYARNTPKLRYLVNEALTYTSYVPIPRYANGRDYAYAIDRARFDAALWDNAVRLPNVTGKQGFSVTDLLWDGERVVGITGKTKGGAAETFTADVVIGADGRFGVVARKTGAQERDVHATYTTSIYYAYWRDVTPLDVGACAAAYEGDGRFGYLVMDSADGQVAVAIEGRSDEVDPAGEDTETFYLAMLQRSPKLWARFADAERITSVRGMRDIGNLYRQAGGAGWALVGDAYHQKDPLDGQGIFDAVVTGKALAQALRQWKRGDLTWEEALAAYDETARVKTYPMFKTLQSRIRTNFYDSLAGQLPGQWQQWIAEDPRMTDLVGKMLTRQIPPDMVTVLAPGIMMRAIARGSLREAGKRLRDKLPF